MANADPIKPVSGKKLVIYGLLGAFVFACVMGFGTYFLAEAITPLLQKHSSQGTVPAVAPDKPPK